MIFLYKSTILGYPHDYVYLVNGKNAGKNHFWIHVEFLDGETHEMIKLSKTTEQENEVSVDALSLLLTAVLLKRVEAVGLRFSLA